MSFLTINKLKFIDNQHLTESRQVQRPVERETHSVDQERNCINGAERESERERATERESASVESKDMVEDRPPPLSPSDRSKLMLWNIDEYRSE